VSTELAPLQLAHGQYLHLDPGPVPSGLRIVSPDGVVSLSIVLTPAGPVLHFGGAGLAIQTDGQLAGSAGRIVLHGRDGVAVRTGGDLAIQADGDLHAAARIQTLTATRGNVNVRANDDVRLDGERVLVNCS